ncbi:MAG: molybdopterin converting factor subunit 1 [Polyangiaceae bacterium]|nr:molybdopterin converting factor subunit 1 [Polyangiaceae bacterium]
MKRVRVLYFAGVRDLIGIPDEELELPDEAADLDGFVRFLVRARPLLDGRLGGVRFAVNETFAHGPDPIAAGDVIAVIPPVAGG